MMKKQLLTIVMCVFMCSLVNASMMSGNVPNPVNESLMFWLKADSIDGLSDGDAISIWQDSSVHGLEFSGGIWADTPDDHRPTYHANVLNGLSVVRFNGGQWLGHQLDALDQTPPLTIFTVVQNVLTSVGAPCAFAHSTNGFNQSLLLVNNSEVQVHSRRARTGDGSNQISSMPHDALGGPFIAAGTFGNNPDWEVLEDHGEILPYVNGIAGDSPNNARSPSHDRIGIGAYTRQAQVNFTAYFTGDIAEILVYDRILTSGEMHQIGLYLGDKYDIQYIPEPSSLLLLGFGLVGLYKSRKSCF